MSWKVVQGRVEDILPGLEPESFDACFCDPPYGLTFMGKNWDRGVPSAAIWREVARALKPGAHLLAAGGTRTYHRLACAIEDAGFEIRDCLMWLYSSGFPKSLDLSKAIDDARGAERTEVVREGVRFEDAGPATSAYRQGLNVSFAARELRAPATEEAETWHGWGTALAPAYEPFLRCRKPGGSDLAAEVAACNEVLGGLVCLLLSSASGAELTSRCSQSDSPTEGGRGSAAWLADGLITTSDVVASPAGATSTSRAAASIAMNIASSWNNIWAAILRHESTFTTETVIGLTTALRISRCSASEIMRESTQLAHDPKHGWTLSAGIAEKSSSGGEARTPPTQRPFAAALATWRTALASPFAERVASNSELRSRGVYSALRDATTLIERAMGERLDPAWEPFVLAMKPLDGTYVENARAHGVAGLNVDGCRVPLTGETPFQVTRATDHRGYDSGGSLGRAGEKEQIYDTRGRWPKNVILDEAAGAMLDEQAGERKSGAVTGGKMTRGKDAGAPGAFAGYVQPSYEANTGGASRFFYCAKVSRAEREAGCDGLPHKSVEEAVGKEEGSAGTQSPRAGASRGSGAHNHHPTLKPIALCKYLATLLLPPKTGRPRRILVPFSGAGSEMIGAALAGWDEVVGIEMTPEYLPIAEARLVWWTAHPGEVEGDAFEAARASAPGKKQLTIFDAIEEGKARK